MSGRPTETSLDFINACTAWRSGDLTTALRWPTLMVHHDTIDKIDLYDYLRQAQGQPVIEGLTSQTADAVIGPTLCHLVDGWPYGIYR